jgi:hypothetical protein
MKLDDTPRLPTGLEVKHFPAMVEVKASGGMQGQATARFASFGLVDADGDLTEPGAFGPDGQEVIVSAYGHRSWAGDLPVGKAVLRSDHTAAYADLQFFMDTQAGRDTFSVLRSLGDLQEFSYGYRVEEAAPGTDPKSGQRIQILRRVKVHEISPVLKGAGVNTGVVSGSVKEELYRIREQLLGGHRGDQARGLAAREFVRFQRIRSRALGV